jgi:arylsulfatase A-like enzyme
MAATPTLDAIASEGLRFEHFYATAPTTLSSHITMLSGRGPHHHGAPRNGFPLAAEVRTLPQQLSDQGWDTIAVLSAKALDHEMGLDRGFRVYDDDAPSFRTAMFQDTAESVSTRSLAAVDARPDAARPLFLFVHFYDAHAPYEAPEPYRSRFTDAGYTGPFADSMQHRLQPLRNSLRSGTANPADVRQVNGLYLGEVAYVDAQIGALLRGLSDRGLLDDALLVVTADHGETLHEMPTMAYSHGTDVADGAIRVPLIMKPFGKQLAVRRGVVERHASMAGLASTIEVLLGLPPTLGRHFWQLVRPGPVDDTDGWPARPTAVLFAEATRPHGEDPSRWNNADAYRQVQVGPERLVGAPVFDSPYELAGRHRSRTGHPALYALLEGLAQAWDADGPPWREAQLDAETTEALEALGYLEPEPQRSSWLSTRLRNRRRSVRTSPSIRCAGTSMYTPMSSKPMPAYMRLLRSSSLADTRSTTWVQVSGFICRMRSRTNARPMPWPR